MTASVSFSIEEEATARPKKSQKKPKNNENGSAISNRNTNTNNTMFDSKKIKELRQLCSEQGLDMEGKKEVLIQRLMDKWNATRVPTSMDEENDGDNEDQPLLNTTQLDESDEENNEFEYDVNDSDSD